MIYITLDRFPVRPKAITTGNSPSRVSTGHHLTDAGTGDTPGDRAGSGRRRGPGRPPRAAAVTAGELGKAGYQCAILTAKDRPPDSPRPSTVHNGQLSVWPAGRVRPAPMSTLTL